MLPTSQDLLRTYINNGLAQDTQTTKNKQMIFKTTLNNTMKIKTKSGCFRVTKKKENSTEILKKIYRNKK